jgi:hypothetical protein
MFQIAPPIDARPLKEIFRHRVFKMLVSKEKFPNTLLICSYHGVIQGSTFFADREFFQKKKRLWKIWPITSSESLFHRSGRSISAENQS